VHCRRPTVKPLRWAAGGLVWLLAGLLAVVGVVLSVTVVLLPLGFPVLMLARRLFRLSLRLVLPRAVVHPVQQMRKTVRATGSKALARQRRAALPSPLADRSTVRKRMKKRLRRAGSRFSWT
jgi:hypothetical protein